MSENSWQPIETAPKDGKEVLMWRKGYISQAGYMWNIFNDSKVWGSRGWSFPDNDLPTHWMPLPTPPTPQLQEE